MVYFNDCESYFRFKESLNWCLGREGITSIQIVIIHDILSRHTNTKLIKYFTGDEQFSFIESFCVLVDTEYAVGVGIYYSSVASVHMLGLFSSIQATSKLEISLEIIINNVGETDFIDVVLFINYSTYISEHIFNTENEQMHEIKYLKEHYPLFVLKTPPSEIRDITVE